MTKPKPIERIDYAAEVEKALDNLANARQRVNAAKVRQAQAREVKARAVIAWTALFPKPTQLELIAAVSKTQAAREQARIEALAAEPATHLDAILGGGMGSSANYGYRRPRAALRSKPPSVR